MREPIEHRVPVEEATLCVFEWPSEEDRGRPPVLLAHATGFHARCWDQVIRHLPGHRVFAVDQRGHGRSSGGRPVRWQRFGEDLAAVVRRFDLEELVGAGHSMGGHAMVHAAALLPERFSRLVLVDPVILPPDWYVPAANLEGAGIGTHPASRRRRHWQSAREMYERFEARVPFDGWDRHVLRDYCEHGLVPDPEHGAWELACSPEFEAEVYMTSRGHGVIHDFVRALQLPVLVVRAMEPRDIRSLMDFRFSPTWPGLAGAFSQGREIHLAERTHFLPMESPELVASWIGGTG